jgi:hypothetical protein
MTADTRRWHHATLTTYGAWLHGDNRGFRTRHHRQHVEGDYNNPPPEERYSFESQRSRELLRQGVVTLPKELRPIISAALADRLSGLGAWVLCIALSGQHAHLLVNLPLGSAREWVGLAKKHSWFVARECGWQGRLWGARSRATLVRSRAHQLNTYRYILRHADQGAWICVRKIEGGLGE